MRLRTVWAAALAAVTAFSPLGGQAPATTPAEARALVTSVAVGIVYIDAGRSHGLREALVVRVPRLGAQGSYRVKYLSSKSAACVPDSTSVLPAVGDTVVFTPVPADTESVEDSLGGAAKRTVRPARPAGPRLRGRVGLRYLGFWDQGTGAALRQPAAEVLLDGPLTPGAPVTVSVDIRSRRTSIARAGQATSTNGSMGVYRAAIRVQGAASPIGVVAGRQYAPTLAGIGLFDGLIVDFSRPRWGAGIMGGVAPEVGTLALSSTVRQWGGYLQARSSSAARTRVSVTAGAIGSYEKGELNREFAFLQATLSSRTISAIVLQELDVNRGWKLAAGEPRFDVTSSYASVSVTPSRWLWLSGGVDNRRNVRLYRDLVSPEEQFDDRFRFGAWASAHLTVARKLRLGADARRSGIAGADSLRTSAYTATASLDRITRLGIGVRLRATSFQTPARGRGDLQSVSITIAPVTALSLDATLGRSTGEANASSERRWTAAEAQLYLRRSWFGLVSFNREWTTGAQPRFDQLYTGVSYRF